MTLIKRSLEQHEEIIESGVKSFIDVGRSLMAIRDEKLYGTAHDTFEAYCKTRWGFGKSQAYRMIESAVVVSDLSPTGDTGSNKSGGKSAIVPENERQARAVADSAPDAKTRAVVWKASVASAPKDSAGNPVITAAVIKKAAEAIVGPKAREPGDEPPEPRHVPERTDPLPIPPKDKAGVALPNRAALLKAFSSRDLFVSSDKARNVIFNNAYEIAKLIPNGDELKAAVDKHMKALFHTLGQFEPAFLCGACDGGGCVKCQRRGYTCCK